MKNSEKILIAEEAISKARDKCVDAEVREAAEYAILVLQSERTRLERIETADAGFVPLETVVTQDAASLLLNWVESMAVQNGVDSAWAASIVEGYRESAEGLAGAVYAALEGFKEEG